MFVFLQLEHALSSPALVTHQIALIDHTCPLADAAQSCVGVTQERFTPVGHRVIHCLLHLVFSSSSYQTLSTMPLSVSLRCCRSTRTSSLGYAPSTVDSYTNLKYAINWNINLSCFKDSIVCTSGCKYWKVNDPDDKDDTYMTLTQSSKEQFLDECYRHPFLTEKDEDNVSIIFYFIVNIQLYPVAAVLS